MFVGFQRHFAVYLYLRLRMFQSKAKPGQQLLWVATEGIVSTPANLYYTRLNKALIAMGFPEQVRSLCSLFYDSHGRSHPAIDPLVYFKTLLGRISVQIWFIENLLSERASAARRVDSLSIRRFLHYLRADRGRTGSFEPDCHQPTPRSGGLRAGLRPGATVTEAALLLRGKKLGIDASTLEANASMRTLTLDGYMASVRIAA